MNELYFLFAGVITEKDCLSMKKKESITKGEKKNFEMSLIKDSILYQNAIDLIGYARSAVVEYVNMVEILT